jgi:hypothetical protein
MSCRAYSLHTADFTSLRPPFTINWSVTDPATITAGQGTNTVKIETVSASNVVFTLTCAIEDSTGEVVSYQKEFTHYRVELDPILAKPYVGRPYAGQMFTLDNTFAPAPGSVYSYNIRCNNNIIFNECVDFPERYIPFIGDPVDHTYFVSDNNYMGDSNGKFWGTNPYLSIFFRANNASAAGEQTLISIDNGGSFKLYLEDGVPTAKVTLSAPQNLVDEKTNTIHRNISEVVLEGDSALVDNTFYHLGVLVNNIGGKIFLILNGEILHSWASKNVDFYLAPILHSGTGHMGVGDDITARGLNDAPVTPFVGYAKHPRLIGCATPANLDDPTTFDAMFQTSEALNLYLEKNICLSS